MIQTAMAAWASFRAMPMWVQIWVAFILAPVNLGAALFWGQPNGPMIAFLAIGGMTPNAVLIFVERGFSKAMALSHLLFWIPLMVLVMATLGGGTGSTGFVSYLYLIFLVDGVSLAFDIPDSIKWWRGDRAVAGK